MGASLGSSALWAGEPTFPTVAGRVHHPPLLSSPSRRRPTLSITLTQRTPQATSISFSSRPRIVARHLPPAVAAIGPPAIVFFTLLLLLLSFLYHLVFPPFPHRRASFVRHPVCHRRRSTPPQHPQLHPFSSRLVQLDPHRRRLQHCFCYPFAPSFACGGRSTSAR